VIFWGAIMNMHSIHSSTSPTLLLARRFNQLTHIRDTKRTCIEQSTAEKKQPAFAKNPEKLI
jgi:hypothetical protein